jgi:hypothetical protein
MMRIYVVLQKTILKARGRIVYALKDHNTITLSPSAQFAVKFPYTLSMSIEARRIPGAVWQPKRDEWVGASLWSA